jgi:hypothetical protein
MAIRVTFNPDKTVARISRGLTQATDISGLKDPLLRIIGKDIGRNFLKQESADQGKFARLKASTRKQKKRKGFPLKALIATGALQDAATKNLMVQQTAKGRIEFGIADPQLAKIAAILQKPRRDGTRQGRRFMILRLAVKKEIREIVKQNLLKVLIED